MDHAEARELLELAATEPRGIDRLLGDGSPEGAALTAHLAGCGECHAELEALRRTSQVTASVVQATPSPELRERTLSYVAAVGRPRTAGAGSARRQSVHRRWLAWPALAWGSTAFASGAAIAVLITALLLGQTYDAGLRTANTAIAQQQRALAGLASVTDWSMRLAADPDAETVGLRSATGGGQEATVVYSSTSREMVMVASTLPVPPEGREYRCWVESGGQRTLVGRMYFAGDLAYWAGKAYALPKTDGTLTFGVSLVPTDSAVGGGQVVLTGSS